LVIIIDQMNAALSGLISSDIQQATSEFLVKDQNESDQGLDVDEKATNIEDLENKVYFSPEKNNVLFASAIDNWAFDLFTFSKMLGQKLGVNPKGLQKYMWGEFYLDVKNKKIYKEQINEKSRPMFVQFVLDAVWKVYESIHSKDMEKIAKIASLLKIELPDNFKDVINREPHLGIHVLTIFLLINRFLCGSGYLLMRLFLKMWSRTCQVPFKDKN
jgi:ribosome assembly protein 1